MGSVRLSTVLPSSNVSEDEDAHLNHTLTSTENTMLNTIQSWLKKHGIWIWRIVYFASYFVGLYCYACSNTFTALEKEKKWWKTLIYVVTSVIIFLLILLAMKWKSSDNSLLKAHLTFLDLMITSLYSYFMDKVVGNQKPDKYTWISSAAFVVMWFSLSRLMDYGFETDLLYFFCGIITVQLMKKNPWLFFGGACVSYFLIILRPLLDFQLQPNNRPSELQPNLQDSHSQQGNGIENGLTMSKFMDCIETENMNQNLVNAVSTHVVEYLNNNNVEPDVNLVMDTLPSNVINKLRESVRLLIGAGGRYERRCCNEYSRWRTGFIKDCLSNCGFQEPELRNPETWINTCNVVVKILFPNERTLCYRVFDGFDSAANVSFTEICKDLILRILSFADTFARESNVQTTVKCIQTLSNLFSDSRPLLPTISFESDIVRKEVLAVKTRLMEATRDNLMDMEKLISFDMAKVAIPDEGGIHPITREVMNHLCAFNERLLVPILDSTVQLLQSKLEAKSESHGNRALGYVFVINNLRYIAHRAQQCELRFLLGKDWFRRNRAKVTHNSELYQRSPLNNLGHLLLVTDEMD